MEKDSLYLIRLSQLEYVLFRFPDTVSSLFSFHCQLISQLLVCGLNTLFSLLPFVHHAEVAVTGIRPGGCR